MTLTIDGQTCMAVIERRIIDYLYLRIMDRSGNAEVAIPDDATGTITWTVGPLQWCQEAHVQRRPNEPESWIAQLIGDPKAIEQRQERRIRVDWPCDIRWNRRQRVQGRIVDVSSGGIGCQLPVILPNDQLFTVRLATPERSWTCQAILGRQKALADGTSAAALLWVADAATQLFRQWITDTTG